MYDIISQDPWLSTVHAADYPDLAVIDLDPGSNVPFEQVARVALRLHEELEALHVPHVVKTSGASGLHVFMPIAPKTTFKQGWTFCELVSQLVAQKHPREATVDRTVNARGKRVYLDYLQNLPRKTVAAAYSVRANPTAGVSTPISWQELSRGVHPEFTISTMKARLQKSGDVWATLRESVPIDLSWRE